MHSTAKKYIQIVFLDICPVYTRLLYLIIFWWIAALMPRKCTQPQIVLAFGIKGTVYNKPDLHRKDLYAVKWQFEYACHSTTYADCTWWNWIKISKWDWNMRKRGANIYWIYPIYIYKIYKFKDVLYSKVSE